MQFWVGVTDKAWYEYLRVRAPDEVNFWQPSPRRVAEFLEPGLPFLFKLRAPDNFIVGGGFFVQFSVLPAKLAWEAFEEKNGVTDYPALRKRIEQFRDNDSRRSGDWVIATAASVAIIFSLMNPILASCAAALMLWTSAAFGQLEQITRQEAVSGLRTALEKGSHAAVAQLGRADGFFGNPQVKIPLPDSLTRTEKMMRRLGMGRYADELILTMNRAAEAAVPEARQLLVDSIRKMTINDAKGILAGGDTAGTEYFRRTTRDPLHGRFLPIVKHATAKVNLTSKYNEYAEKGVALGLVGKQDADLDEYVTQKALDALYFMVAEEEKKIRKDPVQAGSNIIRKVFGALL